MHCVDVIEHLWHLEAEHPLVMSELTFFACVKTFVLYEIHCVLNNVYKAFLSKCKILEQKITPALSCLFKATECALISVLQWIMQKVGITQVIFCKCQTSTSWFAVISFLFSLLFLSCLFCFICQVMNGYSQRHMYIQLQLKRSCHSMDNFINIQPFYHLCWQYEPGIGFVWFSDWTFYFT